MRLFIFTLCFAAVTSFGKPLKSVSARKAFNTNVTEVKFETLEKGVTTIGFLSSKNTSENNKSVDAFLDILKVKPLVKRNYRNVVVSLEKITGKCELGAPWELKVSCKFLDGVLIVKGTDRDDADFEIHEYPFKTAALTLKSTPKQKDQIDFSEVAIKLEVNENILEWDYVTEYANYGDARIPQATVVINNEFVLK